MLVPLSIMMNELKIHVKKKSLDCDLCIKVNTCSIALDKVLFSTKKYLQSTLVISNFTGPDKNVRVISSSRQPNCYAIGMTTVCLCSPKRAWKAHVYGNLNNLRVLQFALLLFVLGDAMVLLE